VAQVTEMMMTMMTHEDIWLGKSHPKMSRAVLGNINTEQRGKFYTDVPAPFIRLITLTKLRINQFLIMTMFGK